MPNQHLNFIGGEWVPPASGDYFENRNPAATDRPPSLPLGRRFYQNWIVRVAADRGVDDLVHAHPIAHARDASPPAAAVTTRFGRRRRTGGAAGVVRRRP